MGDDPARDVDGRGRERKVYHMLLRDKRGREKRLQICCGDLAWFETSPPAGDPDCICSYCGFVILETQIPMRLYHTGKHPGCDMEADCRLEARLHPACTLLLELKYW